MSGEKINPSTNSGDFTPSVEEVEAIVPTLKDELKEQWVNPEDYFTNKMPFLYYG